MRFCDVPRSYHASKVQAELLCAAADSQLALSLRPPCDPPAAACSSPVSASAMRVIVLRPPGIYGERSLYHITSELAAARDLGRGNIFSIGAGDSVFQRCYAGNVAHAHLCAAAALLLPRAPAQRLFNVTDDTPIVNFFAFAAPYLRGKGYHVPTIGLPWCVILLCSSHEKQHFAGASSAPSPSLSTSSTRCSCCLDWASSACCSRPWLSMVMPHRIMNRFSVATHRVQARA